MATQCQAMAAQKTVDNLDAEIRTPMSGVTGSTIQMLVVHYQPLSNGLLLRMVLCARRQEVAIQTPAGRHDWMATITCNMAVTMQIT